MTHLVTVAGDDGDWTGAILGTDVLRLQGAARAARLEQFSLSSMRAILAQGADALNAVGTMVRFVENAADSLRDQLREMAMLLPIDSLKLRAPLPDPRLIVCCGQTYPAHAAEMGVSAPAHPVGFIKSGHTVIGPGEPILLPPQNPAKVDFEGELSLVIGRRCHNVDADEATGCIAGYLVANDVSARDWVDDARRTGDMFFNNLGKQFPSFCPMGPSLVTADEISRPDELRLTTHVNGQLMQSASAAEMSFTFAEILAFWSRFYEFFPGDVITTGSPMGVGAARNPPVYLKPGDTVAVEVQGVGVLTNPVSARAVSINAPIRQPA